MVHWLHHSPEALGVYRGLSWSIAGVSVTYAILGLSRLVPASVRRQFRRKA